MCIIQPNNIEILNAQHKPIETFVSYLSLQFPPSHTLLLRKADTQVGHNSLLTWPGNPIPEELNFKTFLGGDASGAPTRDCISNPISKILDPCTLADSLSMEYPPPPPAGQWSSLQVSINWLLKNLGQA